MESRHHQTSGDERKNLKRASQVNEKTTQNQPNGKDKHFCKILRTILKVDKKRTLTTGPESKKTHDNA